MSLLQHLHLSRDLPTGRESIEARPQTLTVSNQDSSTVERHADVIAEATEYSQAGDFTRSLSLINEGLARDPDSPDLLYARALTFSDWGRLRESLDSLYAAESRGLASFRLHVNVAQICQLFGRLDEAEQRARQAISLAPDSPRAHLCLAAVLWGSKRNDEALESYARAFELAPDRIECLLFIAACKLDQKDAIGGETAVRQAIALGAKDEARSWGILGVALLAQDRVNEAIEAFERAQTAEERDGLRAETFVSHGFSLINVARVSEALELYERKLPSQPDHRAHAHYGWALLTAGRYREGWEQYEFRRLDPVLLAARPVFGRPAWNGQCLQGKTLLVWAEQGIGDSVQFVRFARQLKALGATVVFHVPARLKDFSSAFRDFDRVVLDPRELETPFDYQISTISLARILCPDVASIPADVPYLNTDPNRVQHWRDSFSGDRRIKVGLAWAGNPKHDNDRRRSMALSELAPLWDVEGAQFFSLQKESRDSDAEHFPANGRLIDLAAQLIDLRDTAAAIEALDVVIAVDTAVAHVAGALGKPVWVMLPAAADFRWLMNREDSPWYPTMRLFRQERLGQWPEVVSRVSQALRIAVHSQRAGASADGLLPTKSMSPAYVRATQDESEGASAPSGLSRLAETRYGIVQYLPQHGDIGRSIEAYGEWLQPQVDLLARLLLPGATVLEAPSGIGAHVLAVAPLIGPAGHILAYENSPLLRRILLQNIRANQLTAVATVMLRQLVGLTSGKRGEFAPPPPDELRGTAQTEGVETIDDLLIQRLDLIKLNDFKQVSAILEGAAETLWRLRPQLFLSLPETGNVAPLVEQTRAFGYRCWRLDSALFSHDTFNRREEDLFSGRKAAALIAIPEENELDISSNECVEF